eukprot:9209451-Alexandrium_andersonii.AAC.1
MEAKTRVNGPPRPARGMCAQAPQTQAPAPRATPKSRVNPHPKERGPRPGSTDHPSQRAMSAQAAA